MTRATALTKARALKAELEARGVRCSIELQTGRSGSWDAGRFIGSLGHHIVSRRTQGLTPFLSLIKRGRTGLAGPLANGYGGWDGVARIITMDWANHPGAGGPMTLPGGTIPRNNGRPYLFGWEFEGGLNAGDWNASYRRFMAACLAATLAWLRRDQRSHGEHKTWAPGRKIDRLGYTLAQARNEIKPLMTATGGGSGALEETMFCERGDKGPEVRVLQLQLKAAGHDPGEIDAQYGPATAKAVLAMRKAEGSSVTSGDEYGAWAYWQLQRALLRRFSERAAANAVKGLPSPSGGGGGTLPSSFTIEGTVKGTARPA